MLGEDGVDQAGDDGRLVADDAREELFLRAQHAHHVVAHLVLDGPQPVPGRFQFSKGFRKAQQAPPRFSKNAALLHGVPCTPWPRTKKVLNSGDFGKESTSTRRAGSRGEPPVFVDSAGPFRAILVPHSLTAPGGSVSGALSLICLLLAIVLPRPRCRRVAETGTCRRLQPFHRALRGAHGQRRTVPTRPFPSSRSGASTSR